METLCITTSPSSDLETLPARWHDFYCASRICLNRNMTSPFRSQAFLQDDTVLQSIRMDLIFKKRWNLYKVESQLIHFQRSRSKTLWQSSKILELMSCLRTHPSIHRPDNPRLIISARHWNLVCMPSLPTKDR